MDDLSIYDSVFDMISDIPTNPLSPDVADTLHQILPDILPIIAGHIDCGSFYKSFRAVCRQFRQVADKMHPKGDEIFANHYKTIFRKYHMVPRENDSIILDLPEVRFTNIFYSKLINAFDCTHLYNFDEMVTQLTAIFEENSDTTNIRFITGCVNHHPTVLQKIADKTGLTLHNVMIGIWLLVDKLKGEYVSSERTYLNVAILNELQLSLKDREIFIDLDVVIKNPHYPWNLSLLSCNPCVTKEFYEAHPSREWNSYDLMRNTSDFEFARTLMRDPEDIEILLRRYDVPWDFLIENLTCLWEIDGIRIYRKPKNTPKKGWKQLLYVLDRMDINVEYANEYYADHLTWKDYNPEIGFIGGFDFKETNHRTWCEEAH